MRFIGDIHAGYQKYLDIIKDTPESIQVGDFGIGFRRNPTEFYDTNNHRFIRGNHDWPEGCLHEPNFIRDGTFEHDMMFVGGAYSIDKAYRVENLDWWANEELSMNELQIMIDSYIINKPKIMITHECPQFVTTYFNKRIWDIPSRTRDAFNEMWRWHKPKLWIFGHWHFKFDMFIDDCRFICLDCDSYIDLDLKGDLKENYQTTFSLKY